MIVIIDYGSGNLRSAQKAFEKVAGEQVEVTNNPKQLAKASHIVLPGVGAFGDCAAGLRSIDGMVAAMEEEVLAKKKPFLGICVGMQLLAEVGLEHGEHKGLGWIPGKVVKLQPKNNLPVPHMGWNDVNFIQNKPLINGIGSEFYFVHSYYFDCPQEFVVATVNYGGAATAIVAKDNILGVQFHPEKSQNNGLKLIENFIQNGRAGTRV